VGCPSAVLLSDLAVLPSKVADKVGHSPHATQCAAMEQALPLPLSTQSDFSALRILCLPSDSNSLAIWSRHDTLHPPKRGGEVSDSDSNSGDEYSQPQGKKWRTVQCVLSKLREQQATVLGVFVRSWRMMVVDGTQMHCFWQAL